MQAEVSCRNLRSAVEYVRAKGGREGVLAIVRAARNVEPSLSEEILTDDTAWVSAKVFKTVLEAACRFLNDEGAARKIGAYYVKSLSLGLMAPVFRAARTPELFFDKLPGNGIRFNRVFSITVPTLTHDSAVVRHRYEMPTDEYGDKRACDFTAGAYAAVPELYGGPIASVAEVSCVTRGDPCCEYVVRWRRQKGLIGSLLSPRSRREGLLVETTSALMDALERLEARRTELEEQREKEEQIRRRFQQYVPYQVVERMLGPSHSGSVVPGKILSGELLSGEQRHITALLADIRDFVAYCESNEAAAVVGTLNRFFSMASRIVEHHRGTIDKLIGDAMLAVFGAPYSFGNDADRAVRAALHLRDELAQFNTDQRSMGLRTLDVGICLATGQGITGNIGSELRWDYTVIGAPINLAARLQGVAKGRGTVVLMDEATSRALRSPARTEAVEEASIRGVIAPVAVLRVLAFDERRRFLRYPADIPAFTPDARGQLRNISLGGVLVALPRPLDVGKRLRLSFTLRERELTCEGTVRRVAATLDGADLGLEIPRSSADFDVDFEQFAAENRPLDP